MPQVINSFEANGRFLTWTSPHKYINYPDQHKHCSCDTENLWHEGV